MHRSSNQEIALRFAFLVAPIIAALLLAPVGRAQTPGEDLTALALQALSPDDAPAHEAMAALRAKGPAGLQALFVNYQGAIDRHRADPNKADPMWPRLAAALDTVAAQKDAWAANLYWYTDLAAAKRAAQAANKPILSLRLLGTLDSEFSCANSRFFRTVLYPNAAVGAVLRERFILHWQSHRPVPRLTIDYGDGRKIERTITGNSVHYVLTPGGDAVDVIPGLYGPAAFLRALENARPIALLPRDRVTDQTAAYHADRLKALHAQWSRDFQAASAMVQPGLALALAPKQPNPPAIAATRIATSKSRIESSAVLAVAPTAQPSAVDDATWAKLAALHAADATLDNASRTLLASKAVRTVENGVVAKLSAERPLTRILRNFERSVAEDTVRNEYLFHQQIHEWFAAGQAPEALDDLNEKVYADLFLMPKSDPWLGLVPADTYTALPVDAASPTQFTR